MSALEGVGLESCRFLGPKLARLFPQSDPAGSRQERTFAAGLDLDKVDPDVKTRGPEIEAVLARNAVGCCQELSPEGVEQLKNTLGR